MCIIVASYGQLRMWLRPHPKFVRPRATGHAGMAAAEFCASKLPNLFHGELRAALEAGAEPRVAVQASLVAGAPGSTHRRPPPSRHVPSPPAAASAPGLPARSHPVRGPPVQGAPPGVRLHRHRGHRLWLDTLLRMRRRQPCGE